MSNPSLIGRQLDEYRLEALLGEGGMASVYRALDVRLNRYVAVKVIRTSLRAESDFSIRFEREAQAIAQLNHPNIITLYRFGEKDGLLYMAMQYVDGADLAAVIDSYQRDDAYIEFKEVIRVAHEIGTGLDYAHAHGIIHRDIKPHNIMINHDGRVLITDFGLALMTQIGTRGEIFGSPHYIAPEQAISSAGAVPQSDLYAMGVVLYEMLTGTVPFDATEPLDIAMMHMSDPVPSPRQYRPDLSEGVEKVLLKALEKEPTERYASGKELAEALEAALQGKSRPARTTIANKVALERAANPLPPIPAVVMPTTAPHQTPETQQADRNMSVRLLSEGNQSRWPIFAIAGIGAVALLVLLLILLGGSGNDNASQPTADVAAGVVTSEPKNTEIPTTEIQATASVPATATPTTTAQVIIQPATQVSSPARPTDVPVQGGSTLSLLTNGRGLTTGQTVTNGEFEVEGYCPIIDSSYGVDEDGANWYCTQNGTRVKTLTQEDFNDICRRTYNEPGAFAMQIPGSQPAAYRWRCYASIISPTPQSLAFNPTQTDLSSREPIATDSAITSVNYVIVIRWHRDDSLFLTNISSVLDFPLSALSLSGEGQVNGNEWGIDWLTNGECVAVWKDKGKPKAADTSCTLVGNRLERDGHNRFWKDSFTVLYSGIAVATCDSSPCVVEIPQ